MKKSTILLEHFFYQNDASSIIIQIYIKRIFYIMT